MTESALPWFRQAGSHTVAVRVRYPECDPMGVAHHAAYPVWLEIARTEMLRAAGHAYRDLEAAGIFLVIAKMELRYRRPARYDDVLAVECVTDGNPDGPSTRLAHRYRICRGDDLLATASTLLVSVDADGRMRPL